MDVSSVSSLPVTVPNRPNAESVQATPVVPDQMAVISGTPSSTNKSGSPPPDAQTPSADASRDTTSQDRLAQAVKQVNESFQQKGQNLYASFEKDKTTGINVVKIVDKKTHETISQLPPKEMVALAQFLDNPQGMRGKLIHATA